MTTIHQSTRSQWHLFFVSMARESFDSLLKCEQDIEQLLGSDPEDRIPEDLLPCFLSLTFELSKYSCVAIVFSAMAVEAYIYDYAARNLSSSFVRKYLDRLDLISKWVIVPRLVTGKAFPTGGRGFELLRKLKQTRDGLVHAKSRELPESSDESWTEKPDPAELPEVAKQALEALELLAIDLERIDPSEPARYLLAGLGAPQPDENDDLDGWS